MLADRRSFVSPPPTDQLSFSNRIMIDEASAAAVSWSRRRSTGGDGNSQFADSLVNLISAVDCAR